VLSEVSRLRATQGLSGVAAGQRAVCHEPSIVRKPPSLTQEWSFPDWTFFPDWKPVDPKLIQAKYAELAQRPDVDRVVWCIAVPHKSHVPNRAKSGNGLRERASVVDGKTFFRLSCCCMATPVEIAKDLDIPVEWLHPIASGEQTMMLKLQRRLQDDLHDPVALELLRLKGMSVAQALRWRRPDAGWPSPWWQDFREGLDRG